MGTDQGAPGGSGDRSGAWYRTLVERSTDIVGIINEDGTMQYKNSAMEEHLGYEADDLAGENAIEYVHPDDRTAVASKIEPVIEDDRYQSDPYEYRFRHADGTWVWFESIITDCTETILDGYVVNSRDITERKQQERELRRERDRLDRFASVVSHDLRNPLNVADGQLELAREDHDSDRLAAISDAHDRMRELIENLLALARDGRAVTDLEPVDLADSVRQCWQNVATGDATIVIDTDRTMYADYGRLRRLMENLLSNAIEHGGADVTVEVGDTEDGFYVADDGTGIPTGDREKVFESGYSTAREGTGFGLHIVEEVAGAHGWDVTVSADRESGTRFEITGVAFADD